MFSCSPVGACGSLSHDDTVISAAANIRHHDFYWPALRCRGVCWRERQQAGLWQRHRSVMVEHFTAIRVQSQKFSLQPFLFFHFTGPLFNTGSWLFFQLFPPEVRLLCSVKTAFLFFVNLHFIGALFNSAPINTGALLKRGKKTQCGHI